MFQRISLRRITSSSQYNPAIDAIRFLAIVLVLSQHIFERVSRRSTVPYGDLTHSAIAPVFSTAEMGVSIFFALSGYVLFSGLLRSLAKDGKYADGTIKRYFSRRISRIEPPYVIALTLVFLFLSLTHYQSKFAHYAGKTTGLIESYLASLGYLHNIVFGERSRVLGVAWSLEVEVQFYILAPLLAFLIVGSRRYRLSLGLGLIASLALIWCAIPSSWLQILTLVNVFPCFLGGMLLAESEASFPQLAPRGYVADGLFLLGLGILYCRTNGLLPPGSQNMLLDAVATFFVLLGPLRGRIVMKAASYDPAATIGGMCYSIYLIHLPILEPTASIVHRLGLGLPLGAYLLIQFAALGLVALIGSTLFYVAIERPCMVPNWPQSLWKRLCG